MTKVRVHIATSLDGFVAGPNQTLENPLGDGGEHLHEWLVELKAWRAPHGLEGGEENINSAVVDEANADVGAEIMGRGKFGPPQGGPWGDDPWQGWWGENPPFHKPVFVPTHPPRGAANAVRHHLHLRDRWHPRCPGAGPAGRRRQGRLHRGRRRRHQPVP